MEIDDSTLRVGNNRLPRVTIMSHRKKWSFRCRFHDEVQPRERYVDFSTLKSFKVLHQLPLVYSQTRFEVPLEADKRYNYWQDVYGQITRPKLGHAGGRYGAEMKPKGVKVLPRAQRTASEYDENVFESQEMGIGRSLLEKEHEKVLAAKMEAWNKSLAEKRELENEERNRLVAEEESRVMAEAQAKQMEKAKQRRADEEARKKQVEEENSKWDTQDEAMGELKFSREKKLAMFQEKSQSFSSAFALEPLSREAMSTPKKSSQLDLFSLEVRSLADSPLKKLIKKESKLQSKALKTLPRIQSRYSENRKRLVESDFEYGMIEFVKASVHFTFYDDYVGSSAEKIPAFIGLSLESDMTDDPQSCNSVLPLANEETRIYQFDDLSMISFEMTASKLAADTLEVFLFEDTKGKKPTKIGSAFFDFDNVRKNIGADVECTASFDDGNEDRGVVHITIRATSMD